MLSCTSMQMGEWERWSVGHADERGGRERVR
jgi:hypothetical protein